MKARNRIIKPEFFQDRDLAELKPMVQLLYIGLWQVADRDGRLEDNPDLIKGFIFPYHKISVDPMLKILESKTFIVRYAVQKAAYIWIPAFKKHQKIHPNEAQSVIPLSDNVIKRYHNVIKLNDIGTPKVPQCSSSSSSSFTSTSISTDKMSDFDKAWDSLKKDKKLEQYSTRSIDLDAQRFKMVNWVGENPAKKSYRRFIINWLNGALGNKPSGTDKAKEAFLARSED